jgi:hypothetical protein
MNTLDLQYDGWAGGNLEDAAEALTLTRLKILVGDAVLTRNVSRRGGGVSEAVNVPLLPLAEAIADNWWMLLHEPFRAGAGDAFRARHRLDVPMHGFSFPAIAICSGGDDTVLAAWANRNDRHASIEFLTPTIEGPESLSRDQVEAALMDLVETCIERLRSSKARNSVTEAWSRVRESISEAEEYAYCRTAGKLGLDPYDPDAPDLNDLASSIDPVLFEEVSDAAFLEDMFQITAWVRDSQSSLNRAPSVDLAALGTRPVDTLSEPAWVAGLNAAQLLRDQAGLDVHRPRRGLEDLLGEVLLAKSRVFEALPPSITTLMKRENGNVRVATAARSAREQRFKSCAAIYVAWSTDEGAQRATTTAFTRRQQAARSFAAEVLAPRAFLRGRASTHGFTADEIEALAGELICPNETIVWQAFNAGIPLRGVELHIPQPAMII